MSEDCLAWRLRNGLGKAHIELARLVDCRTPEAPLRVFIISREEIQSLDISRLRAAFGPAIAREEMLTLLGQYIFAVSGYEDVADELYEIEEVRTYFAYLQTFPLWLAFANLTSDTLKMIAACSMSTLVVIKRKRRRGCLVIFRGKDLTDFFISATAYMQAIFKYAGLSSKASDKKLRELVNHFRCWR